MNPHLRESKWQFAKSAYAIEVNPWPPRTDVEAVLLWRGTIVAAFGNIETNLGEVAIRASRLPQYEALRAGFPYSAEKRVAFLRAAFCKDPLRPYQGIASVFLDRFSAAANLRHMMAHARMQVLPGMAVFHDFAESNGVEVSARRTPFALHELEHCAWKAARLSRIGQRLLVRLNTAEVLPTLE
jgi:hypothetical protein